MHGVKTKAKPVFNQPPGPFNGDFLRFYKFSPLGLTHG